MDELELLWTKLGHGEPPIDAYLCGTVVSVVILDVLVNLFLAPNAYILIKGIVFLLDRVLLHNFLLTKNFLLLIFTVIGLAVLLMVLEEIVGNAGCARFTGNFELRTAVGMVSELLAGKFEGAVRAFDEKGLAEDHQFVVLQFAELFVLFEGK